MYGVCSLFKCFCIYNCFGSKILRVKIVDKVKYMIIGIIAGVINGLFGSGGGMIIVPALAALTDMEQYKAHATSIAVILPITLMSSLIYYTGKYIDFNIAWTTAAGGIAGGLVGAYFLKKIPARMLRVVFGVFIILSALRMII